VNSDSLTREIGKSLIRDLIKWAVVGGRRKADSLNRVMRILNFKLYLVIGD